MMCSKALMVNSGSPRSQRRRTAPRAAACLMLFLWFGTLAVTISPTLHQLLHSDAQSANHICLVTQVKQQALLAGLAPVIAPAPAFSPTQVETTADSLFPRRIDRRLAPGRAPPAASPLAWSWAGNGA